MKSKRSAMLFISFLVLVSLILLACSLSGNAGNMLNSASPTPPPTDTPAASPTPLPSNTPLPTDTLAPTDTPSPTPVPTNTPPPTPVPTNTPTEVLETATPEMAHVNFWNGLNWPITVELRGPTPKKFFLTAFTSKIVDLEPGLYEYTITATHYLPLTGQQFFAPGDNTFNLGRAKQ